ncbi:hypothetical protein [Luteimonas salinilitoris]|uniref:TonB-dependent receptor n=1 Tax=Luteimonas salinilitoris TaxID=3237697 RepID=A0ABV4HVM1_9GAMM
MRVPALAGAITTAVALASAPALAEEAADLVSSVEAGAQDLDRIVVTATRTSQNLIDTPASVTVQDMGDLRLRGMDSLGDEFRGGPGVSASEALSAQEDASAFADAQTP